MNACDNTTLQSEIQKLETIFASKNTNFKRLFYNNYIQSTITDYQTFLATNDHYPLLRNIKTRAIKISTFNSIFGDVKKTLETFNTITHLLETTRPVNPHHAYNHTIKEILTTPTKMISKPKDVDLLTEAHETAKEIIQEEDNIDAKTEIAHDFLIKLQKIRRRSHLINHLVAKFTLLPNQLRLAGQQ